MRDCGNAKLKNKMKSVTKQKLSYCVIATSPIIPPFTMVNKLYYSYLCEKSIFLSFLKISFSKTKNEISLHKNQTYIIATCNRYMANQITWEG